MSETPLRELLRYTAAGGLAGVAVAITDTLLAVSATGLEPLAEGVAGALFQLIAALSMFATPLLGLIIGGMLLGTRTLLGQARWERVVGFLKRPVVLIVVPLVVVGAVVAYGSTKHIVWSALPWELPGLGALGLAVGLVGLWASRRWPVTLWAQLAVVALVGVSSSVLWNGQDATARELALERASTASTAGLAFVDTARWAMDGDGDGHPTALCVEDCDCADDAPGVYPGAAEVIDNGVDEDCDGRDLTSADRERFEAMLKPQTPPRLQPTEPNPEGAPAEPVVEEPEPLLRVEQPNVLIITVDTLRADHLGFLGYPLPTSPVLDALSETGVVFEQARSTGPMTRFSVGPMMTGKYFAELRRSGIEWPVIHEDEVMLAERFDAKGYHTAAFHSIDYFEEKYGFAQGFDHYDVTCLEKRPEFRVKQTSDYITEVALEYLDSPEFTGRAEQPFMLWVYYSDPHHYYIKHSTYGLFKDAASNPALARYDSEIRFTDEHIGKLLEGLEARGLRDDLLIVLVSDHGEALDEKADHGQLWHGANLFDEAMRVPLVFAGAGLEPRRVSRAVSTLDLSATLIELAGLEPDDGIRGVSLAPWLAGEDPEHPPLFFEKHRKGREMKWPPGRKMLGMLKWPHKVVWTPSYNRFQIYDLEADPSESNNIVRELPEETREALTSLLTYWSSHGITEREPD